MNQVLTDSDVLIEVLRGRDAAILSRWEELRVSDTPLLCSPVTIAEIWHGARPKEHSLIEALFDSFECVPVDGEIGRWAGEYLRVYHPSHQLELGDALIAATALVRGAALWTRNRKHYPMPEIELY
jgi:predicted nucleic acid-binding protein